MLKCLLILLFFNTVWTSDKNLAPLTSQEADLSKNELTVGYSYLHSVNQYIVQKLEMQNHHVVSAPPPTIGEPWPKPSKMKVTETFYTINKGAVFSTNKRSCILIVKAIRRYRTRIFRKRLVLSVEGPASLDSRSTINRITVFVDKCSTNEYPHENMNEQYNISVEDSKITIKAHETWGALRGLESMAQLIFLDYNHGRSEVFSIKGVQIVDRPVYSHRGVMVDTARHYISVNSLLENLDAMEMNKMNVFHWHIVDDQSFPFVSKSHPEMSEKGAFDETSVYNATVIRSIVQYARERGIRVIPELDMPGHTYSWGKSHPELLVCCTELEDSKFQTHSILNPVLQSTFDLVDDLLTDLAELFPDNVIHLGFDEYDLGCFISDVNIKKYYLKYNILQSTNILGIYFNRIYKTMQNLNKTVTVWQELYDELAAALPKDVIVQIWKTEKFFDGAEEAPALNDKFIYSKEFYLDQQIYGNKWLEFFKSKFKTGYKLPMYRGAEAAMWTEFVSDSTIISNIWPTTCAVAELLWNNKEEPFLEIGRRVEEQRCRMIRNNIRIGVATGPGSCDFVKVNDPNTHLFEKPNFLISDTKQEIHNHFPMNLAKKNSVLIQEPVSEKIVSNDALKVLTPMISDGACHPCRYMLFFIIGSIFGYILHFIFNLKPFKLIIMLCLLQIVTFLLFYER